MPLQLTPPVWVNHNTGGHRLSPYQHGPTLLSDGMPYAAGDGFWHWYANSKHGAPDELWFRINYDLGYCGNTRGGGVGKGRP